jgi:hypothetical protein
MIKTQAVLNSRIEGHVYSSEGTPLGAVKVTCDGRSTSTLFDGFYKFENLAPGTYNVTASLKGFRSESKIVSVKDNETLFVDFNLNEATGTAKICGYVRDAKTGKPLSGGTVMLILPTANRYATVDENGFYEFSNLPSDTYEVWTSVFGYEDIKAIVRVGEGETKTQDFYCEARSAVEPPWG